MNTKVAECFGLLTVQLTNDKFSLNRARRKSVPIQLESYSAMITVQSTGYQLFCGLKINKS